MNKNIIANGVTLSKNGEKLFYDLLPEQHNLDLLNLSKEDRYSLMSKIAIYVAARFNAEERLDGWSDYDKQIAKFGLFDDGNYDSKELSNLYEKTYYDIVEGVLCDIGETLARRGYIKAYSIDREIFELYNLQKEYDASRLPDNIELSKMTFGLYSNIENGARDLLSAISVGMNPFNHIAKTYSINFSVTEDFLVEKLVADKLRDAERKKAPFCAKEMYDLNILVLTSRIECEAVKNFLDKHEVKWKYIPISQRLLIQYREEWDKLRILSSIESLEKNDFYSTIENYYRFAAPFIMGEKKTIWRPARHMWDRE